MGFDSNAMYRQPSVLAFHDETEEENEFYTIVNGIFNEEQDQNTDFSTQNLQTLNQSKVQFQCPSISTSTKHFFNRKSRIRIYIGSYCINR